MSVAAAKRYAEALYELACDKDCMEAVSDGLLKVKNALGSNPEASKTFFGPRVPADVKSKLASEKLLDGVHEYVANLVHLLIDRRREGGMLSLILTFFELREAAEGIVHANVEVARAMSDEELAALTAKLSTVTKKKVISDVSVNPDLLGGVRITIGSTLIDGSLKRSLETLGARLKAAV
ncbi:MAG: F-type H+-transporting ATPase subunit delta [Planctomycetota bacterium]|jgi:F-type H+-transporting ATPase subunit delta